MKKHKAKPSEQQRRRRCGVTGKRSYTNKKQVETFINSHLRPEPLYPYKCPVCNHWHVSRQNREPICRELKNILTQEQNDLTCRVETMALAHIANRIEPSLTKKLE